MRSSSSLVVVETVRRVGRFEGQTEVSFEGREKKNESAANQNTANGRPLFSARGRRVLLSP